MMKKKWEKIVNSLDDIVEELDYHLLWYKWFSKYPPNKEIVKYNKMSKSEQMDFLKQKEIEHEQRNS